MRPELFATSEAVSIGLWLTAVASICFVVGVGLGETGRRGCSIRIEKSTYSSKFDLFCLIGGWTFVYGLSPLSQIPSLGALISKGGAVWMLGVVLGLRRALQHFKPKALAYWLAALSVYPIISLVLGGFLSYGTTASIISLSALSVSHKSLKQVLITMFLLIYIGLTIFVNYFAVRGHLRDTIWSNEASRQTKLEVTLNAFKDIDVFDISNDSHAFALDERLNQNYFVGLAAMRIDFGVSELVRGRSLYEGVIAFIPRVLWPEKPVTAGSGTVVRDVTGLNLNVENTSWGVGQVLEFYINFGWWSLIVGFILLGWIIRRLDFNAAVADVRGDKLTLLKCFLVAVALNQPIGSVVELCSGAAAAYLASLIWFFIWQRYATGR
jgi:hypothetical protein